MEVRSPANAQASAVNVERPVAQAPKVKQTEHVDGAGAAQASPSADDAAHLEEAVSKINTVLNLRAQSLEFKVDEESKRTIVTVIDKDTQEVIRQMPSREALDIAKALDQLQSLLKKQSA